MRKFVILTVLLATTCGCTPPRSTTTTTSTSTDNSVPTNVTLTPTEPYYPQPDFDEERFFKVEDQHGCKWWINSGHKFDTSYIALDDKQIPECKDQDYAPLREIHWLDKDSVVTNITYEKKKSVQK